MIEMQSSLLDRDALFIYAYTRGSFAPKPMPLTQGAVTFASACHGDESRDDGTPYINHPLAACKILIDLGVNDDHILAATILHDVVENKKTTLEIVKERFGDQVTHLVDIQTKREGESIEEYYSRIQSEIGSIIGKGADRLTNITNIVGVFDFERLKLYINQTEQYVIPMLKSNRYAYLEYTNVLVVLHDSIKNIVNLARHYIRVQEENERLKNTDRNAVKI
jgi:(p)ppGpp synthase/HD superfamily hydrolase